MTSLSDSNAPAPRKAASIPHRPPLDAPADPRPNDAAGLPKRAGNKPPSARPDAAPDPAGKRGAFLSCRFRLRPLSRSFVTVKPPPLPAPTSQPDLSAFAALHSVSAPVAIANTHRPHRAAEATRPAALSQVRLPTTPSSPTPFHYAKPTRQGDRPRPPQTRSYLRKRSFVAGLRCGLRICGGPHILACTSRTKRPPWPP